MEKILEKNEIKKERNSGLELLRIICIILVIMHHYSVHGGWDNFLLYNLSWNVVFVQLLSHGGKMACDIFMIITGYFMIKSKVNFKKILLLIGEIVFYSWTILAVFAFFKIYPLSKLDIFKEIFPIFYGNWFLKQYLIVYLLMPFINPIILEMEEKKFKNLTIGLIIIFSVIPTFTNLFETAWQWSEFDNFIIMYFVGAYIRLYPKDKFVNQKRNLIGMTISIFILLILSPLMDLIAMITKMDWFVYKGDTFRYSFSIFTIIPAYYLFLVFNNFKFKSKTINWIASSTLGIYLIHDNELPRHWIWKVISPNNNFLHSNFIVIHAFTKIVVVFVVCLVIDKIRIYTIEKIFKIWIDRNWEKIVRFSNKFKSKLAKIIDVF